ncbi:MAG: fumarylacetoacetate hydrolase family protein [Kiloniellales bacterium]
MRAEIDARDCLPADGGDGLLIGRVWAPGETPGPAVVVIGPDGVTDVSRRVPTVAALLDADDPVPLVRDGADGPRLGSLDEILLNSPEDRRDPTRPWFLAPADLQAIKACGVTFVKSLLERVIEEQARGDPAKAEDIRRAVAAEVGGDLRAVEPGSAAAERLKQALIDRGMWSQYLEVGIGPYAEVFTKCQPMSAVGPCADIGLHPDSVWNNPEPEVVLVVNARGSLIGATLGNDTNLRDFEGRSALLLGQAKDNNGSCALGPFIRLIDETFTIDDLRAAEVRLEVRGDDGFRLDDLSSMREISRDVTDLVAQTINANHQYPDGLMLFTGTMFAPTQDRDRPGEGFTHKLGDLVSIASPKLGTLVNRVGRSDQLPPWIFGSHALMRNLSARGLI